jgi:uncharacterized membrane protein
VAGVRVCHPGRAFVSDAELDPLALRATPHRMRLAARAASLSPHAASRGVDLAVATPSPAEWTKFLSGTLAFFGAGSLLAGIVCFVAFNWDRIGRYGKFALLELAIVGVTLLAWKKLPAITGRIALLSAAVLVGPLLAIYGQTYQTGADPYGLFLTWAGLIIPWALLARFGALWLLVVLLLDVSLVLFYAQVLAPTATREWLVLPVCIAAMHAAALMTWEWQLRRATPFLEEDWALRAIAVVGFGALVIPAAVMVFQPASGGTAGIIGLTGLAAAVGGALWYYQRVRRDLFMVTLAAVAGMTWVTVFAARAIFDWLELRDFGFFIMAGFVIWEITYGVKLYRRARAS